VGAADQFQNFLAGNAEVEKITAAAGVQGPPAVSMFSPVEAAGTSRDSGTAGTTLPEAMRTALVLPRRNYINVIS